MTNGSWKDRIRTAASREANPSDPKNQFLLVLEEFVMALNGSPWIHAILEQASNLTGLSLVVRPKYRRDMRSILMQFWLGPDSISVMSGNERSDFRAKGELETYLVDFVENSAFPQTVEIYREIQSEHVEGRLRRKALFRSDAGDVVVIVDSKDHNELARRAQDGKTEVPLAVSCELMEHQLAGEFDPSVDYAYLESGGFALKLPARGVTQTSQRTIRCHGEILGVKELES